MIKSTRRLIFGGVLFIGIFLITGCTKQDPETTVKSDNENRNAESSQVTAEAKAGNSDSSTAQEKENSAPQSEESGVNWLTDYEKAKAKAQKEGKDLVLNFSGSDWCYWCIRLDKEVFSQDEFADEAEKYFVFMLVDFPYDTSGQSEEVKKQNERLAQMYGFRGLFPTIFVASADGKPYAMAEYKEGGPKAYLDYLLQIQKYKNK